MHTVTMLLEPLTSPEVWATSSRTHYTDLTLQFCNHSAVAVRVGEARGGLRLAPESVKNILLVLVAYPV